MKRLFILFLILFSALSWEVVNAQVNYHHYLDSTFFWYEADQSLQSAGGSHPCPFGGTQTTQRFFHFMGQHLLQGEWWYAMHLDYQVTYLCAGGNEFVDPIQGSPQPSFWLREDSVGNIWGLLPTGPPVLLFEFGSSKAAGDTIWMSDRQYYCPIAQVDSVQIGSVRRARYHCQCDSLTPPSYPSYVIEGFGINESIFGFDNICYDYPDQITRTLCLGLGGDTLHLDTTWACGEPNHTIVAIDPALELGLHLGWDPVARVLTVSPFAPTLPLEWHIWDLQGREVLRGKITESRTEIPGMPGGIFLLSLTDGRRRQILRIANY